MPDAQTKRQELIAKSETENAVSFLAQMRKLQTEKVQLDKRIQAHYEDIVGCLSVIKALRYGSRNWLETFLDRDESREAITDLVRIMEASCK